MIRYEYRTQNAERKTQNVKPLSNCLPGAIAEMLDRQPLSVAKVAFAWHWAVGPAVERATTIALRNGMLEVTVSDAHWRREIQRSTHLILARLDAMLGEGTVRDLRVEIDPIGRCSFR